MNFSSSSILFVKSVDATEISNDGKRQLHGRLRFAIVEYHLNDNTITYQMVLYRAKDSYLLKIDINKNFETEFKDSKTIEFKDSSRNSWLLVFSSHQDLNDLRKIVNNSQCLKLTNNCSDVVNDFSLSEMSFNFEDKTTNYEQHRNPIESSPQILKTNLDAIANQNNESFNTLLSENRSQSSELRFMITNIANKIDLLSNRMDRNNLKYADNHVDEILAKNKQENLDLKNQLQNVEFKFKQEIEHLKAEKCKLKKADQKLKEIISEQKNKIHENELLQLQINELIAKNNEMSEKLQTSEDTIYQQRVLIADLENQQVVLDEGQQLINKDQVTKCHDHVKRLMDTCFREIRQSYQASHIYNGADIISTIAPKIVKTTYDIISSLNTEFNQLSIVERNKSPNLK